MEKQSGLVTVIVTTRNEERNIRRCLESVAGQDYPDEKIEVIVVDNSSSDSTVRIARDFTDKVFVHGPERSAQRNFGTEKASGEFLLYLDADMSLTSRLISECVERARTDQFVGLYIPERVKGKGFWGSVRDFERGFYTATDIDCVRFVRHDAVKRIGGFDEGLTGPEDWDFDRRIRSLGRVGCTEAWLYHCEEGFSLREYLAKKTYYAGWFHPYVKKWGKKDRLVRRQLGLHYRFFGVFFENGKWKRLIRHPVLAAGMYLLRFLVGLYYFLWGEQGVLLLTPFFSPNIGGVEAYLDSLCDYASGKGKRIFVLTYQPLTVRARGEPSEKKGNLQIRRYPWFGRGLFFRLENRLLLNLLYTSSGLLLYAFLFLLRRGRQIKTIHAHGLNAALVALVLGAFFNKKVIVSTHTIYRLSGRPQLAFFARILGNRADLILALSEKGKKDLVESGVPPEKIKVYHYWVDASRFDIKSKEDARRSLGLPQDKFIGLFVGRFVEQKGLRIVSEALKGILRQDASFIFIGDGPERTYLEELMEKAKNIVYAGIKRNDELADYYNAADVLLWGSLDQSYLGRVCIEALYCGLPVIAGDRCRILGVEYPVGKETLPPEAGFLLPARPEALCGLLDELISKRQMLLGMRRGCRDFALSRYGIENADKIIQNY